MPLHPDWKEFLRLLNSNKVEYLIVGAHALALHGIPRYTRDIDVFVQLSDTNFEDAWLDKETGEIDGVTVQFLSARCLRKNKLATGRTKDIADVESLLEDDAG